MAEKNKKFVCYFMLIFVYINSGYALNTTNADFSFFALVFLTVITLWIVFKTKKIIIKMDVCTLFYFLFSFIVGISYFVHFGYESKKLILKILLLMLSSYIFCNCIDFDSFIHCFVKTMYLLSVISIIAFLMQGIVERYLPCITNENSVTYYIGGLFYYIKGINRVMSIFWEPGIFACYLIFSLVLTILYKNNYNKYFIVFALSIILTQSTTGFVLFILILLLKYLHTSKNVNIKVIIVFFSIILFLLNWNFVIDVLIGINRDMFIKLTTLQHSSTGTRLFSFKLNYMLFKECPLLGYGFAEATLRYSELQENTYALYRVGSQTSTSGVFLSALGIGGILYTVAWIYGIIKNVTFKKFDKIIVLIITLIIINVEPNTFFSMSYIIMFYFLKNSKFRKLKTIAN